jgi:type I restriction enzyme M protein
VIAAAAHSSEIGQAIDDAMRAIEKENIRLKDVLPKTFARPELDKRSSTTTLGGRPRFCFGFCRE